MAWEDKSRASYQYCMEIIARARKSNKWIAIDKDWYSVEEFFQKAQAIDANQQTEFVASKIIIDDPVSAIGRMKKSVSSQIIKVDEMQKKLARFAERVAKYYQDKNE